MSRFNKGYEQKDNINGSMRSRPYRDDRSRFKNIVIDTEKFNYASNTTDLTDEDGNICSPYVLNEACNSFDDMGGEKGLKQNLIQGIYAYGFDKPSSIQSRIIPQIIKKNKDILAQAQSGTGKTGAFMIGVLENVDENLKEPQAIILSPTCELATQTHVVGRALSHFFVPNINFSLTVGGSDRSTNIRELGGIYQGKTDDNIAQIIIATPGRLIDLLNEYPHLFQKIKMLVIDECDELLSGTFRDEIKKILIELKHNDLQICLFSATLTNEVTLLSNHILDNPAKILIKKEKITLEGIKQTFVFVPRVQDKNEKIKEMLESFQVQQFIVYVNSKNNADSLKEFLKNLGFPVSIINSSMSKYERSQQIKDFKLGHIKCLISTDVLSRGIDIQHLSLVINYDLPKEDNIQCYVHRIGRTGRFGRKGLSINIITPNDQNIQNLISLTFNCKIIPFKNDFINDI